MTKLTTGGEVDDISTRRKTDMDGPSLERSSELETSGKEEEGRRNSNIVDFDGPDDPENPLNWSMARKTTSIVIVSLTALLT